MLLPLDVTVESERRAALEAVAARWGGVDVLVNNAGLSYRAVTEHVTEADRLAQLDANFIGPMELTKLALPHMREQRYGRIINVPSVGGMTAMPTMSIYSASKFALEGASESLWYEMRPFGVRVSLVRPGFINSDGWNWIGPAANQRRAPRTETPIPGTITASSRKSLIITRLTGMPTSSAASGLPPIANT